MDKAIPHGFVFAPTAIPETPEPSRFDEVYSHFPYWGARAVKGDKINLEK